MKSNQPGPHCGRILNMSMRSWALSDPSGSCYTKRKPGRQILAGKKKKSAKFWIKIVIPSSADSLIPVETTFNGEHFHLEHFVTFARNIFVNNCIFFPFLQSLSHLCLAVSISPKFYMTVLIFSLHNTLITGSLSPCSVSHCLWNEKHCFTLI